MKVTFIALATLALFFAREGRGDDCNSMKNGESFCLDDTTTRTCMDDGKYTDYTCPSPAKCVPSPTQKSVICREMRRTVTLVPITHTGTHEEPQPAQPSQPSQPSQPAESTKTEPAQPAQPAEPTKTEPAQPSQPSEPAHPTKTDTAPVASPKDEGKQADQGAAPVAAAGAADKPETCTADIGGSQQTLKPGDRYCVDEKKHRVCNYGEWIEDSCPEGFKCLKSPTQWQVLCRQVNRNAKTESAPTGGEVQHSEPSPPTNPDQKPQPPPTSETKPEPQPVPPTSETKPAPSAQPQPPATSETKPAEPQPPTSETKPETAPEQPPTSEAKPQPAAGVSPSETNTCPGGLTVGQRKCTGENTFQLCDNDGKLVDDKCPDGSVCKQSPSGQGIVCRQFVRNAEQQKPHERR